MVGHVDVNCVPKYSTSEVERKSAELKAMDKAEIDGTTDL